MRTIKFRAFLPVGEWIEPDEMEQKYEMVYDLAFEDYEPINDLLNKCENLMQFTGLQDKQGKDVYEKDIILVNDLYGLQQQMEFGIGANEIAVVEWDKNICGYIIKLNQNFGVFEPGFDDGWQFEVIGNIYENPELLEK